MTGLPDDPKGVDDGVFHDPDPSTPEAEDGKMMSLVDHLTELRYRILVSVGVVLAMACFTLYHSRWITKLITNTAPGEVQFQVLSPTEAVFIQFKVALLTAVILSFPVILYQIWAFIAPGLKEGERRWVRFFLPMATLFFALGGAFAYFLVIPIGTSFLLAFAQGLASVSYTLEAYTSFVLFFLLVFGVLFQTPFLLILLAQVGFVTSEGLAQKRKPIIIGIFVAAAILTPTTDLVVQCLMAAPAWVLFELSLVFMRFLGL